MKFAACVFGCILASLQSNVAPSQQLAAPLSAHLYPRWWASMELGAGQLKLSTSQFPGRSETDFAMGFAGGYQPADWMRVGLHLNGWLLQAFDPNDPIKGESVSNVGAIVDVLPVRKARFFARGGFGRGLYSNNRPTGTYGSGSAWEAGGGFETPVRGNIRVAPVVEYSAGTLGIGDFSFPLQTALSYSVLEFKLTVIGNLGHRRR